MLAPLLMSRVKAMAITMLRLSAAMSGFHGSIKGSFLIQTGCFFERRGIVDFPQE